MLTLTVYRTRFDEDGVVEGEYGPDKEVIEETEEIEPEIDQSLAQAVADKLYDLAATEISGSWWSDPDGSQIIDYTTARRESISVHLPDNAPEGLYDAVSDIIERTDREVRIKSNIKHEGSLWQSYSTEFYDAMRELSPGAATEVERLMNKASSYVWGWQDRMGETDSDVSLAFGYVYGLHAAKYAAEKISMRHDIKSAYERWSLTGRIERD